LSIWFNGIQPQFRTIDGLTIRFAQSEQRDDHALLLSPWPESLFAFEPTWDRLAEHTHLVAIDLPGFGQSHRNDVEFAVEGGVTLRGWLFVPDGPPPHPAITMAHGFAGVKEHGLERFAAAFAAAGFVVLVHDHRGFGASGGAPRFDVDPWVQIADWRRAISFLESQPVVDENRIGLWGTSYAGGHAIVLGATDRRLRAVVAQVPTISGYQQSLRRVAPDLVPALEAAFADDERRQFHGAPPATQAVVSADPSVPAAYRSPQALAFYTQPVPEGVWENTMTLRSTRAARMYEPGTWVARVSPTPLLMIVGLHDTITVTDLALGAYEQALAPKKLVTIDGDHFDPYLTRFDESSGAAIAWFTEHLTPPTPQNR
jgi:fermentation-respiration switch protein FrsA (DUF1100 family)